MPKICLTSWFQWYNNIGQTSISSKIIRVYFSKYIWIYKNIIYIYIYTYIHIYIYIYIHEVRSTIISAGSHVSDFAGHSRAQKINRDTDKTSKHDRRTIFLRDLVFCTHQQKWCQLCFILSLFIFFLATFASFLFLHVPPVDILMPSLRSRSDALSSGGTP